MIIFTLKARRTIERAVSDHGNDRQRALWRSFAESHPEIRREPSDPCDDGKGPFPLEVADTACNVLEKSRGRILAAIKSSSDENEISDLEMDLAFVGGLQMQIRTAS